MKTGKSYPPKLQTYMVCYGIKGLQSDVPSTVYDALWGVDNGVVTFNESIDMGNKKITGVADGIADSDVVNVKQLNDRDSKSYITIFAEKYGSINTGYAEWGFGGGGMGSIVSGYCMPVNGVIKIGTISAVRGHNPPNSEVRVNLILNGSELRSYSLTIPNSKRKHITIFQTPLNVAAGDVINFISKTTNSSVTRAIASLLIEIDVSQL